MNAPIETKVTAAGAAALIAGFVVSLLVLKAPFLAPLADLAQAAIAAVVMAVITFAAGWLAKHTPRPPEPVPPPPPTRM